MIELEEVITQLREELERVRTASADAELRFELGPIELEVTCALEKQAGANAKVRFWVVDLGGNAGVTATNTQRIKLTLKPTLPVAVTPNEVARTSAYVSGKEEPGER